MKKIYNYILYIILILIGIVVMLITIKYAKNAINEKEISKEIDNIKQAKQQTEFKGYKVIGVIKIPKINIEYPILEKTTKETLKISITKFYGNAVNEIGNLCLAGHNNRDGTMFGKIKKLELEDIIELTDLSGVTKEYKIYDKYNVNPNDTSILEVKELGIKEVTLITCTNGNKERLIIKAKEI